MAPSRRRGGLGSRPRRTRPRARQGGRESFSQIASAFDPGGCARLVGGRASRSHTTGHLARHVWGRAEPPTSARLEPPAALAALARNDPRDASVRRNGSGTSVEPPLPRIFGRALAGSIHVPRRLAAPARTFEPSGPSSAAAQRSSTLEICSGSGVRPGIWPFRRPRSRRSILPLRRPRAARDAPRCRRCPRLFAATATRGFQRPDPEPP